MHGVPRQLHCLQRRICFYLHCLSRVFHSDQRRVWVRYQYVFHKQRPGAVQAVRYYVRDVHGVACPLRDLRGARDDPQPHHVCVPCAHALCRGPVLC